MFALFSVDNSTSPESLPKPSGGSESMGETNSPNKWGEAMKDMPPTPEEGPTKDGLTPMESATVTAVENPENNDPDNPLANAVAETVESGGATTDDAATIIAQKGISATTAAEAYKADSAKSEAEVGTGVSSTGTPNPEAVIRTAVAAGVNAAAAKEAGEKVIKATLSGSENAAAKADFEEYASSAERLSSIASTAAAGAGINGLATPGEAEAMVAKTRKEIEEAEKTVANANAGGEGEHPLPPLAGDDIPTPDGGEIATPPNSEDPAENGSGPNEQGPLEGNGSSPNTPPESAPNISEPNSPEGSTPNTPNEDSAARDASFRDLQERFRNDFEDAGILPDGAKKTSAFGPYQANNS